MAEAAVKPVWCSGEVPDSSLGEGLLQASLRPRRLLGDFGPGPLSQPNPPCRGVAVGSIMLTIWICTNIKVGCNNSCRFASSATLIHAQDFNPSQAMGCSPCSVCFASGWVMKRKCFIKRQAKPPTLASRRVLEKDQGDPPPTTENKYLGVRQLLSVLSGCGCT